MKKYREKRNWSQYNQKLKQIARVEFFISEEAITSWHYSGKRKSGGKIIYSDQAIELSLILKEYYKLAYRQTQGFMESVFNFMKIDVQTPDYTTMSRRCGKLQVSLRNKLLSVRRDNRPMVVAVDSTGLSL